MSFAQAIMLLALMFSGNEYQIMPDSYFKYYKYGSDE